MFSTLVSYSSMLCPWEICQLRKTENDEPALDLETDLISFED